MRGTDGRDLFLGVTEVRTKLKDLLDELEQRNVVIFRRSRPAGVLIHPDRLERLIEKLENLQDELSVLEAERNPEDHVPIEKVKAELGMMGR